MWPDSNGSRNTSSTLRSNSVNSSRNNMPWLANEISPGRGTLLPPLAFGVSGLLNGDAAAAAEDVRGDDQREERGAGGGERIAAEARGGRR